MKFNVDEISSLIKAEIGRYKGRVDVARVGKVLEVGDGIARIYGLDNAMAGEMLEFESGAVGEVFNLTEESVGAVIYGDYVGIKEMSTVRATGQVLTVPAGFGLLGRVVDGLCEPIDDGDEINFESRRLVESPAPGIAQREPVCQPLQTGIKCIDSMIPVGKGQRELIIGDRKTGKTAVALDTIINQKDKNVICIYVAIGQKESTVAQIVHLLRNHHAMEHTVVVSASAGDSAAMQFVAPYTATSVAEFFVYEHGRDVLCVYDDLTKHAVAYRQLSLLLRRPPGREAYPGDIFYIHSRLLERSAKLNKDSGGGSLTALPIVETLEGQVSAYIPTNIISITDGQIYLQRDLFLAGIRPAVDVGISVSRVGGKAQPEAMQKVAPKLRLELAAFRELEDFARLGTELDDATRAQLERGKRMVEILKQKQFAPLGTARQVISILAGSSGLVDDVELSDVGQFIEEMLDWLGLEAVEYIEQIETTGELSDELEKNLTEAITAFKTIYKFSHGK
ncbi:MAG TPA: F0F1 ATP synthase subunit alpha [Planctomycetes bacterium]|nr:F0F1 ATP synthase subunit alpha [Planctomycetota bacterium]HIJ70875.1 F0F1 ATP synthase subunit alpha [Planctomycetota bacterium]